jgi:hypothetical protein
MSSPNIIQAIKSRGMRWVGHVGWCIQQGFGGKPKGRHGHGWEDGPLRYGMEVWTGLDVA